MLEQGIQAERRERRLEQREHDEEVRTLSRERAAVLERDRQILLQRIDHQVRPPCPVRPFRLPPQLSTSASTEAYHCASRPKYISEID